MMSLVPGGISAVTVACGMLGTGQTVVTSVPMLIVGGTVVVKNRSETGRGERGGRGRKVKRGGGRGGRREIEEKERDGRWMGERKEGWGRNEKMSCHMCRCLY